ncbi:MAG: hypothetical protein IPH78_07315 [Bacteroidetes bacterium]|nr:hypothetical protein [Bacteroidota bacterium]
MNTFFQRPIDYFITHPRKLFLLDSAGALYTAACLWLMAKVFNAYVGMPPAILLILSAAALCFALYSAACFLLHPRSWASFLRLIALANLLYVLCTIGLLWHFAAIVKWPGWCYFLAEIIVIVVLVILELKTARRNTK